MLADVRLNVGKRGFLHEFHEAVLVSTRGVDRKLKVSRLFRSRLMRALRAESSVIVC